MRFGLRSLLDQLGVTHLAEPAAQMAEALTETFPSFFLCLKPSGIIVTVAVRAKINRAANKLTAALGL
jgi:hypothetical protein